MLKPYSMPNNRCFLLLRLTVLALMFIAMPSAPAMAYDVEKEIDGVTFWFNLTSDSTCALTYGGRDRAYSGDVVIPITISHEDREYSVTAIEEWAFNACPELTSVVFGDNIASYSSYTFIFCPGLEEVNFGNVTDFQWIVDCPKLTRYTVAETYPEFISYDGMLLSKDGKVLRHCPAYRNDAVIPEQVTEIGSGAFYGLTKLDIPDNVEVIDDWIFTYSELQYVSIGRGLKKVGKGTFGGPNCEVRIKDLAAWCAIDFQEEASNPLHYSGNLYLNGELVTDLVIPEGVEVIKQRAFCGCQSIMSVRLSNTVKAVEHYAFNCPNIVSVTLSPSLEHIGYSNFGTETEAHISDLAAWCSIDKYQAPHFGKLYLNDELLTELTIPEGVTSVSDYAFFLNPDITKVTLPSTLRVIGKEAFAHCHALTEIVFPEGGCTIGDGAFSGCTALTELNLPKEGMEIGNYAFSGCEGLTSLTLPYSIGNYAFNACKGLTEVTLEGGAREIGQNAFWNCTSLVKVTMPDGFESIGGYAFYGCKELEEIDIPMSVRHISATAFNGTKWFDRIMQEADDVLYINNVLYKYVGEKGAIESLVVRDGTVEIADAALYGNCGNLKTVVLPKSLKRIGASAFGYCMSLETIALPDGLQEIGNGAFNTCEKLKFISIPNSVTKIDASAFAGCLELTAARLPEGLTEISPGLFNACPSLRSIHLPETVTSIGDDAFSGCGSLEIIDMSDNITRIGRNVFEGTAWMNNQPEGDVYIGYIYYGFKIDNWGDWYSEGGKALPQQLVVRDGTRCIAGCASNNYNGWQSVSIPEGVVSIGEMAFGGALTNVLLPQSLRHIASYAFNNTRITDELVLPANIESVGNTAFAKVGRVVCHAMTPPSLGYDAFYMDDMDMYRPAVPVQVPNAALAAYRADKVWNSRYSYTLEGMNRQHTMDVPATELAAVRLDYDAIVPQGVSLYHATGLVQDTVELTRVHTDIVPRDTWVVVTAPEGAYCWHEADCEGAAIETVAGDPLGYADIMFMVDDLTLDQTDATLEVDDVLTLQASVPSDRLLEKYITWASADTAVATVTDSGTVAAVGAGTTAVTATCGSATATCVVTVPEPVEDGICNIAFGPDTHAVVTTLAGQVVYSGRLSSLPSLPQGLYIVTGGGQSVKCRL